jgi:hypothetical protein
MRSKPRFSIAGIDYHGINRLCPEAGQNMARKICAFRTQGLANRDSSSIFF